MFDSSSEIEIGIRLESGGDHVTVRWPSDDEWSARNRTRKVLIRRLGRGVSETVPPEPSEADLAMYQKIALNGTPTVTKGEAYQIAEALAVCSVTGVEIEGDQATVTMNVMTGPVTHRLKIPTADQVVKMRRAGFRILDLPFNQQQIQLFLEPGARLWDECGGTSEDYVGPVPAIHKDNAVRSLVEFIDNHLGPKAGAENF